MYKQINISVYLTIFNLFNYISAVYLEAASNYVKPRLERNNIVNKGLWIRNNKDKKDRSDFIFRANSLDVDNVLQNNFDAFGQNYVANTAFFSAYNNMERNKRSTDDKSNLLTDAKLKCNDKTNCPYEELTSIGKSKIISTLKPASVFNDYPYEIAVLLNNKKDHLTDISEEVNEIHNNDGSKEKVNHKKAVTSHNINNENSLTIKNNNLTILSNETANKFHTNRFNIIPRSMTQREYESELIKKIEFTEDLNTTDMNINKIDRNIFDKEEMAWHNAPTPSINAYKILPKKVENVKSKPINERGLLKVLSMLTKTFKKIMKQHQDIKRIHNKLYDLNDEFTKNAEKLTSKFEDFNSKYLFMVNLHEKLKVMEVKLKEKEQRYNNREKDLAKNLKEFENQQKKFLAQQRQFYNVQKLMLAQNEKINIQQNVIAKTQSEISHRQNHFARILKKAKQIYIDSRNLTPTKLNSGVAKPKIKPVEDKEEPARVSYTNPSTTTTVPSPIPTTETVKINLFSIPALTRLENQDQMILDEKDYQPVDELIYKYYFNNTFIDDLMKNKILATFIATSEGAENNIAKNKRNQIAKLNSTLLTPVNKTIGPIKKQRNKRWIKHSKKNNHKKVVKGSTTPISTKVLDIKENIVQTDIRTDYSNIDLSKKVDPFITMALNFCKEIGQSLNLQVLNWCVEKALRRLKVIDLKIPPLMTAASPATLTTAPQMSQNEMTLLETSPPPKLPTLNIQNTVTTEDINAIMYFPDNDELEDKLKEYEIKPDTEGTVYYDGSLHASDLARIDDADSGGFSDIMPGLDSNSRVQVDPMAFDLQAHRRADVRKINERIIKMEMD